jgi:hypothetical protein
MNYKVELNDTEVKLLMSLIIDEYRRIQSLAKEEESCVHPIKVKVLKDLERELLSLIGKLENVFAEADMIKED